MVYGGKPSRGCRTCRQRRVKCDEGKPTCKRCEKSRRECGGYRPEFEIVHRDQTKSTVYRLRTSKKTPSAPPPPASAVESSSRALVFVQEEPQSWDRVSSSPSSVLTVPLAQRASCYFASNFILVPLTKRAPHGFMEYLIPLIELEPAVSSLRYAFNACAFALLNHHNRSETVDLAQLSLKEHTLALGETYKALGHPNKATAHATLATVLLLSLYESITANKESRMLAWRSHIDGAVNIIRSRGRDDICQTKTGALLFAAVRHQLVSRTLSSGMPIPFGTDWWMSVAENNTLLATSQHLALKYTDLRTESNRLLVGHIKTPQSTEQIQRLVQKVRALDREIVSWQTSVPEQFRFQTLCWVWEDDMGLAKGGDYGQVEVFPGRVDIYPDFVTASAWNISRVSRLLLAALSIRLTAYICSPIDYLTTPGFQASRKICEETIPEILASVPYHFGWHMKCRDNFNTNSGISGFACGDEGALKALPAFLLIWPLTCVKNHDITKEEQRAWAKGRLRVITDGVGLKYAQIVNDVELRFPSMLIGRDGLPASPNPFSGPGLPLRPVDIPPTPNSMASTKSPPPG